MKEGENRPTRGGHVGPSFWDDQEKARKVGSENNRLNRPYPRSRVSFKVEDLEALCELCEEDDEDEEMAGVVETWNHFLWKWTTWRSRFYRDLSMPVPRLASMRGPAERNPVIGPICLCGCFDGPKGVGS